MLNLTADKITKVSLVITGQRASEISDALNLICPMYGIKTPDIFHEFIANVLHESACFTRLTESLNYQAIALTKLFSRKRISIDDCYRYGRTAKQKANPEAIANIIYGGQWGLINLGNTQVGDGWRFRGAGAIQITGRSNVTKFTNYYNTIMGSNFIPEVMADILRHDILISIHSACWVFSILKGLIDEAIDDKMKEVAKRINGGLIGYPERMVYYERAKQYIT